MKIKDLYKNKGKSMLKNMTFAKNLNAEVNITNEC